MSHDVPNLKLGARIQDPSHEVLPRTPDVRPPVRHGRGTLEFSGFASDGSCFTRLRVRGVGFVTGVSIASSILSFLWPPNGTQKSPQVQTERSTC